jgi:hypothetical protein
MARIPLISGSLRSYEPESDITLSHVPVRLDVAPHDDKKERRH